MEWLGDFARDYEADAMVTDDLSAYIRWASVRESTIRFAQPTLRKRVAKTGR